MHRAHSTFNIIHTRVTFLLQIRNTRYLPTANRPKLPILTPLTKSLPLVQQAATPWFTSHKPNSSGAFSGFSPHPHPPSSPTSNLISQPTTQHCHIQDKFFWEDKWSGLNSHDTVISSVQSLSCVRLFATPWITAHQASLSITNSQSLLKPTSIKSVMPSSHLILCRALLLVPQPLSASGSFPMSQLFTWGDQSTGVSASASVLPMNTQD